MTNYAFDGWVLPNPPLGFDPDEEVWRDNTVDGCRTVVEFAQAMVEAFERWVSYGFEFFTRDEAGIALQRCVHPQLYDGGASWPPMDDEKIDRFIDQAMPEDVRDGVTDHFRDFKSDPATEGHATDTTTDDLDPEGPRSISYTFDMGAGWDHSIERQEPREGSLAGGPSVIGEQGEAPLQHPDLDE